MLYSEEDYAAAKKLAARARALMIAGIALALAGGLVPMLLSRNLVLSIVASCALALATVFFYGVSFAPAFAYKRFMTQVQEGIRHTYTASYVEALEESVRDGVRFILMHFQVDEEEAPRRLYYDASLASPAYEPGRSYHITHTGNSLVAVYAAVTQGGASGRG